MGLARIAHPVDFLPALSLTLRGKGPRFGGLHGILVPFWYTSPKSEAQCSWRNPLEIPFAGSQTWKSSGWESSQRNGHCEEVARRALPWGRTLWQTTTGKCTPGTPVMPATNGHRERIRPDIRVCEGIGSMTVEHRDVRPSTGLSLGIHELRPSSVTQHLLGVEQRLPG
jgi:hypothetical protein